MKIYSTAYTKSSYILFLSYFLPDADSYSLLKIQDIVHSYKNLMQLKSRHCVVLVRKIENMEKWSVH
jgi:hypothetical protein